jgi:hypothetical protein
MRHGQPHWEKEKESGEMDQLILDLSVNRSKEQHQQLNQQQQHLLQQQQQLLEQQQQQLLQLQQQQQQQQQQLQQLQQQQQQHDQHNVVYQQQPTAGPNVIKSFTAVIYKCSK